MPKIRLILLRVIAYINLALRLIPLTGRGLVLFILGIFILNRYAYQQQDLIASVFGGVFVFLVPFISILLAILYLKLKRQVKIRSGFLTKHCFSKQNIEAFIAIENCRIPPYFVVLVERVFEYSDAQTETHLLSGMSESKREILDTVYFPHRGIWKVQKLRFTLEDRLGLSRLSWEYPLVECQCEVFAPNIELRSIPSPASSAKAGEEAEFSKERSGELFDMKSYDPTDGVKHILWKVYARSNELVVRRPEPALHPDGVVAVYLVASKREDHVAGAFQSYLEKLEAENIQVLFGLDGYGEKIIAKEEILHAINRFVWSDADDTYFKRYLECLTQSATNLNKVVVFINKENINRTNSLITIARDFNWECIIVPIEQKFDYNPTHANIE
jgi:hypothetical protein